jgi:hypothetical protein
MALTVVDQDVLKQSSDVGKWRKQLCLNFDWDANVTMGLPADNGPVSVPVPSDRFLTREHHLITITLQKNGKDVPDKSWLFPYRISSPLTCRVTEVAKWNLEKDSVTSTIADGKPNDEADVAEDDSPTLNDFNKNGYVLGSLSTAGFVGVVIGGIAVIVLAVGVIIIVKRKRRESSSTGLIEEGE